MKPCVEHACGNMAPFYDKFFRKKMVNSTIDKLMGLIFSSKLINEVKILFIDIFLFMYVSIFQETFAKFHLLNFFFFNIWLDLLSISNS